MLEAANTPVVRLLLAEDFRLDPILQANTPNWDVYTWVRHSPTRDFPTEGTMTHHRSGWQKYRRNAFSARSNWRSFAAGVCP